MNHNPDNTPHEYIRYPPRASVEQHDIMLIDKENKHGKQGNMEQAKNATTRST